MKGDDVEIQVKTLITMDRYLYRQLNVEPELASKPLQNLEEPTLDVLLANKEKKHTKYSDYDEISFILHMLTKAPKTVAPVARKYNIHEGTVQRWWNQYKMTQIHYSYQKFEAIARN